MAAHKKERGRDGVWGMYLVRPCLARRRLRRRIRRGIEMCGGGVSLPFQGLEGRSLPVEWSRSSGEVCEFMGVVAK
jgi:hypothetical protein